MNRTEIPMQAAGGAGGELLEQGMTLSNITLKRLRWKGRCHGLETRNQFQIRIGADSAAMAALAAAFPATPLLMRTQSRWHDLAEDRRLMRLGYEDLLELEAWDEGKRTRILAGTPAGPRRQSDACDLAAIAARANPAGLAVCRVTTSTDICEGAGSGRSFH